MIKLSRDQVEYLHRLIAKETGGAVGIRDEILLDSALASISQTFDGKELYPTIEEKGARLGFNLISNHAFIRPLNGMGNTPGLAPKGSEG